LGRACNADTINEPCMKIILVDREYAGHVIRRFYGVERMLGSWDVGIEEKLYRTDLIW
jgi:hypothetical protein